MTLCLLCTVGLQYGWTQQLDLEKLEAMSPRNIGPAGMSGRVTSIDVVRSNTRVMYVGTASGGLWKSVSGGIDWEPIFEEEKVASIGAVAISQKNPDVLWVGTGEGNPRNSVTGGYGIYRSLDAGKSWELMGLENTRNIHRIIIHPDDPKTIYVGAIGSPWGAHPERGVFKTTDGGKTWQHILKVNDGTGAADMIIDPSNPDKLIVAMWEHKREPWFFNSGGEGSGMYMTIDGGDNWKQLTSEDGLPKGNLGRMGLAISTNNPEVVYALIEAETNGFYRSDDGGYTWSLQSTNNEIGNRPFYYADIYVDPKNENRIYSIFTFVNVSQDGGRNFGRLFNSSLVHVDNHALYINPDDPDFMILGNDGGLSITRDAGQAWRFVENLPIGQFYHIAVDDETPYNVYGGMQDNGTWTGPAYNWRFGGLRNSYYFQVTGGDGFDAMPDPDDSRYGYAQSQGGFVQRYDKLSGHTKFVRPTHPDKDMRLRFNWNAAIAQDPFNNNTIYFGSQFVHKSTNKGDTWEVISPDLTTNDTTKQQQRFSGGLTMDATGAENHTTILAIEPSPLERGVIWAGTDDGKVQITRDGGESWTDLTANLSGIPAGSWVAQVRASKHNKGEAVIVVNNYRRFDFEPYLLKTTDYGATWKSLIEGNDIWGYSLSFVQDAVEPNLMFYGTEFGLYVTVDGGNNWTQWTNDYPTVSTMDMVIHPTEHDLVIGSFGRGVFVLDDIRPLRLLAAKGAQTAEATLAVVEPADTYLLNLTGPTGEGNPGSGSFVGTNRSFAAQIKFFANNPADKKKEEAEEEETKKAKRKKKKKQSEEANEEKDSADTVKFDQVMIEIYNSEGSKIRTLEQRPQSGLNVVNWGRTEKGINFPSRQEPREGAPEPAGSRVLPGTYKVVLSYGNVKDSTSIEVKADPRVDVPTRVLRARYEKEQEFYTLLETITGEVNKWNESYRSVDKLLSAIRGRKGDEFKEIREKSEEMKKTIESFRERVLGEDYSGPEYRMPERAPLLNDAFFASFYISSSNEMPGATQDRLLSHARANWAELMEKATAFYDKEWKEYKEAADKLDFSPFIEDK
ncbi:MAG: hypothetical protein HEP71_01995 [Roseivirga sp.]|nr:hypothetical protein [Roseivirga sp.]